MQKFEFLRQPLLWFWIAVVRKEKKKKRKKIPKIVATFVNALRSDQLTCCFITKWDGLHWVKPFAQEIHCNQIKWKQVLLLNTVSSRIRSIICYTGQWRDNGQTRWPGVQKSKIVLYPGWFCLTRLRSGTIHVTICLECAHNDSMVLPNHS